MSPASGNRPVKAGPRDVFTFSNDHFHGYLGLSYPEPGSACGRPFAGYPQNNGNAPRRPFVRSERPVRFSAHLTRERNHTPEKTDGASRPRWYPLPSNQPRHRVHRGWQRQSRVHRVRQGVCEPNCARDGLVGSPLDGGGSGNSVFPPPKCRMSERGRATLVRLSRFDWLGSVPSALAPPASVSSVSRSVVLKY
jgi:hypothetical protein